LGTINTIRETKKLLDGICPNCTRLIVKIIRTTPDKKEVNKKCLKVVCADCKKKMVDYAKNVGLLK